MEQILDIFGMTNPSHFGVSPSKIAIHPVVLCVAVLSEHQWQLLWPILVLSIPLDELQLMLPPMTTLINVNKNLQLAILMSQPLTGLYAPSLK